VIRRGKKRGVCEKPPREKAEPETEEEEELKIQETG